MNKNQVIKFMTNNMSYVGFGEYQIACIVKDTMDSHASMETSEIGQQLLLTLRKDFFNMAIQQQENILLHELIHAREDLRQQRVDEYTKVIKDEEEEKYVNSVTMLAQKWVGQTR